MQFHQIHATGGRAEVLQIRFLELSHFGILTFPRATKQFPQKLRAKHPFGSLAGSEIGYVGVKSAVIVYNMLAAVEYDHFSSLLS